MNLTVVHRSPTGLLRVLVACSLLVPLLLFAGVSWVNYRDATADAIRELLRSSAVAREHAAKLFDGENHAVDRVLDLVRGMDANEIKNSERKIHEGLAAIVARLPHAQSVLLASRDGHPLASAGSYPVPPDVDLTKRDYFKAIVDGHDGIYISNLQVGDINRQLFFGLARPWHDADGTLQGLIDVAASPAFFQDFYKILIEEGGGGPEGRVITLVRDDGQILVRYPPIAGPPPRAAATSPFLTALKAHPDEGVYESHSIVDASAPARIYAYRKVQGYPLYVSAGRSRATITSGWLKLMASHLVFGVPATLALFAISEIALVRTRREQEALRRAQQEIERRQLAEAALLQAQRLEAVGQLTGGVAHDFNNLLTVILGSAETAIRHAEDPVRVRRIVEQIMVAAQRGGEITQKLLAFSGRQSSNPETINLNKRLREFKPLLDRAARGAIEVKLSLDAGLEPVRLDPGHFEAAILNLVVNARDAMADGGSIVITTSNVELRHAQPHDLPAGAYVRVAVSDTGCGMDPDTAAKAFEPFFTTKDIGKGTGLGLSQVFGFGRQAGGDVRITTAPGEGTTVEILLPGTEHRPAAERSSPEMVPLRHANEGEVVLVVEDEPVVLEVTVEHLHDLGYDTSAAANAPAALERLRSDARIDLLFSDVVMPGGMNGLQLAVEARRLRPGLKVLLTSGYTAGHDKDQPYDVPLLTKPYNRGDLATILRAVLKD